MLNVNCMREIYIFQGSVSFLNVYDPLDSVSKYPQLFPRPPHGQPSIRISQLVIKIQSGFEQTCQGLE